ncbi:MAG: MotA/TolQ/ExbB proton channel family protein [bacterium]|nr:MotA/TolQ/ExbB proton channel family protein [bacterium]
MKILFQQIALLGDVWVLWILIGLSILGGAIFYERLRVLRDELRGAGASSRIVDGLKEHSRDFSDSSVAILEQVLHALLLRERSMLERRLVILGTIGSNAPFIGLLGTVLGVIQAFHDLAITGAGGTAVVMSGIASALVITGVGLFVAIPAVIANNYFRTMIEEILGAAEADGRLQLAALSSKKESHAKSGGAKTK